MSKSASRSQNPVIRLLTNYSLSIVLLLLFLASWAGQLVTQMIEFRDDAQAHGESFALGDFIPAFFSATFENWQSEFLQLLTFVVLTSFLIHKGSHESKDEDEETKEKLDDIRDRLQELERTWPAKRSPLVPLQAPETLHHPGQGRARRCAQDHVR